MKHYLSIPLLLLILMSATIANAQDPNFYIFLCFGQSNMEGQGTIESQDRTVSNRFKVMQAVSCTGQPEKQWRTATPPICRCSSGLGPADYFGRTMVDNLPSNITIGIVHVAVAGCKIELFDKVKYATYAAGEATWMQNIIAQYGGNPYGKLVELAKLAQKDGVIKGILMHQGESNTGDNSWPTQVNGVYTNLLNDLGLNAKDVPLLAGQVVDAAQGGQCASMNNIINTLPNTIPTSYVISSSGCTDQSDNLHFNSAGYRLLGERYAMKMLQLLPTVPADYPVVSITSPKASDLFTAQANITIEATASDPNGSVTLVEFYNGTTKIGQDDTSPFSFQWTDISEGTYSISAIATDNDGNKTTSSSVAVKVNIPQSPYGGTPHQIPGTIEFEHFDEGGQDIAYYDDSPGSETTVTFRNNEDVDIEECSDTDGGYNIGYGKAGEWLEYTVNVKSAGIYNIDIRFACEGTGRTFSITSDGTTIAQNIAVPNTEGWQKWQTLTIKDVSLYAGIQVIRFTIGTTNYINLNKMTFIPVDINEPPVINITSPLNNGNVVIGNNITISATATSDDATIESVTFIAKGTTVGTDITAPYSAIWTPVSTGDYTLAAIATDSNGLTTETSISVTVVEEQTKIHLLKGWNIIGYPYEKEADIKIALSSIWNNVEIIKNDIAFYDKSQSDFLNKLIKLNWGKGYLIKVSSDCDLTW